MSNNHFTTTTQGLSDGLEIGCYQAQVSGDLKLDNQLPLLNKNPNTGRTSLLVCDITTAPNGTRYGYSWIWQDTGILLLDTQISTGFIKSVFAVGTRSEVPVFMSACNLNYTDPRYALLQFSNLIAGSYDKVTTDLKLIVQLEYESS